MLQAPNLLGSMALSPCDRAGCAETRPDQIVVRKNWGYVTWSSVFVAMLPHGNRTVDAFLDGLGEFTWQEFSSDADPRLEEWFQGRVEAGDFLPARHQATGNGGRRPAAYVVAPWTEKDFRTMDRVMRSLAAAEEDPRIRAELQKTLKAIRPKAKEIRREAMLRLGYHVPALQ